MSTLKRSAHARKSIRRDNWHQESRGEIWSKSSDRSSSLTANVVNEESCRKVFFPWAGGEQHDHVRSKIGGTDPVPLNLKRLLSRYKVDLDRVQNLGQNAKTAHFPKKLARNLTSTELQGKVRVYAMHWEEVHFTPVSLTHFTNKKTNKCYRIKDKTQTSASYQSNISHFWLV